MEKEPKDDPSGLIWLARALDEIELPESGDPVPSEEPAERRSPASGKGDETETNAAEPAPPPEKCAA